MLQQTIKQIAKKLTTKGKGLFNIIELKNDRISYESNGNTFSFLVTNEPIKGCGTFAAGHVHTGTRYGLTYESDYQHYGNIPVASFVPYHITETDNPDYILRNSIYFILGH